MNLPNLFKLEKLKIETFGNRLRFGLPKETLKVMFNPESYVMSYRNVFSGKQGINSTGKCSRYILSEPGEFSLKIIIDGTGVSEQGIVTILNKKDVYEEVQHFLNATAFMERKTHEPKFLRLSWGKLNFPCRLQNVTVTYTLFDQSGNPLRAELDTSFEADTDATVLSKQEGKSSPDLTHKRVVKEGDTLLLLCESIYGTPDYYLQVAKANKITDFRNLKPGQEVFFPPVNK